MNNTLGNMEQILDQQICGFHRYILEEPFRLAYASENLCRMTGMARETLLDESLDRYAGLVHPADRGDYAAFLQRAAAGEWTHTAAYRLVKGDGSVVCVRDSLTVSRTGEGVLVGDSVLTDITDLMAENRALQFLNETIPCGFLRYTCEKQPRITYINQRMIEALRFPEVSSGEPDDLELYKSNILLLIPMEERRRFLKYLDRVRTADTPIAGEMTLIRCDGTRAHFFGWVTRSVNDRGEPEFQSVCMDITETYRKRKAGEAGRYLEALADVYDKIFEFNLYSGTVKCIRCGENSSFKRIENIAVRLEDALEKWVLDQVAAEDHDRVRKFFTDFCRNRLYEEGSKPPQISYRMEGADGAVRQYSGLFIRMDEAVSLFCCRELQNPGDPAVLKIENDQLRERMRDLVMQFSDGIAAFEISPDARVKPLYASENVCEFFGYTKEEWLPMTERFTPIGQFVARSEATYGDFASLLQTGEAEFSYFDYQTETRRRIKAICSAKEPTAHASRYVMLYAVDEGETEDSVDLPEDPTVCVRTFGYFDVFVGDKPIAFRNKKSKELLALLVDRKGGYITSEEAISYLWEDEPANPLTLSRYRKVALRLKCTLEEYSIPGIVEAVDGKRRIVPERIECDLYQYLSGKEEYAQLFKGSYLTNYSWGEMTLGELLGDPF